MAKNNVQPSGDEAETWANERVIGKIVYCTKYGNINIYSMMHCVLCVHVF